MKTRFWWCALLALISGFQTVTVSAQSTAFTYQGRLNDGGEGASGTYDLRFSLFTTSFDGVPTVPPVTNSSVAISNGLFTVSVGFGSLAFRNYLDRYLEIAVRTNGGSVFTTLAPRQFLAPMPSAQIAARAEKATFALTATSATAVAGAVTNQWQSDVATAVNAALNVTPRVTTEFGQTPSFSASLLTNGAIRAMFGGDSIGADAHGEFRDMLRRESVAGLQDGAFQSSFPYWLSSPQHLTSDYGDCWWAASWLATDGQEVTWGGTVGGGFKTFDTIKFWYVASPTNGTAAISTSTDGTSFTPVASVNTATTRQLMVTNISVPRQSGMVKMSATGNVVTVWIEVLDSQSQGARVAACNAGGRSLVDFLAMGPANIATLLTNLDPTLIVWQQLKAISDRTNWPAMKTLFQTYAPKASVVLISGHHVTPAAEIPPNTVSNMVAIDRLIATTNGWAFVDLWSGQSWSNVVASGFSSDGIHFYTPAGLRWTGNQLIDAIGLKALIATHNATIISNRLSAAMAAGILISTNPLSTWPTAPSHGGQCFIGNSNGVIYLLTSLPGGTTWAATNKLGP